MAVAHDALLARLGLEIGMLCEKLSNLRFDGLGQQRTRAAAQDLCEGIGKGPWLGELDDVTVRHGVSLLHWRSGGVEHHHDTPPYPVTPSPTSGHSSPRFQRGFQDRPLGARLMIAASNCAQRCAIVISPRWHEMLISESVAASAFASSPITRQDGRSAIVPAIGLRSTQPIETLLTEPRRSSVTFAPTVWP